MSRPPAQVRCHGHTNTGLLPPLRDMHVRTTDHSRIARRCMLVCVWVLRWTGGVMHSPLSLSRFLLCHHLWHKMTPLSQTAPISSSFYPAKAQNSTELEQTMLTLLGCVTALREERGFLDTNYHSYFCTLYCTFTSLIPTLTLDNIGTNPLYCTI